MFDYKACVDLKVFSQSWGWWESDHSFQGGMNTTTDSNWILPGKNIWIPIPRCYCTNIKRHFQAVQVVVAFEMIVLFKLGGMGYVWTVWMDMLWFFFGYNSSLRSMYWSQSWTWDLPRKTYLKTKWPTSLIYMGSFSCLKHNIIRSRTFPLDAVVFEDPKFISASFRDVYQNSSA